MKKHKLAIIAYFVFVVIGCINATKVTRIGDLKICSLVLLGISIILFEIAYKKDSIKIAVNGIEIIIVAIITLFLPYILFELERKYQNYFVLSGVLIIVYYIIKAIVLVNSAKAHYKKENSDIKDITKEEINKDSFLDEEIVEEKIEVKPKAKKTQTKERKKQKQKKKQKKNQRKNQEKNKKK